MLLLIDVVVIVVVVVVVVVDVVVVVVGVCGGDCCLLLFVVVVVVGCWSLVVGFWLLCKKLYKHDVYRIFDKRLPKHGKKEQIVFCMLDRILIKKPSVLPIFGQLLPMQL